MVDYICVCKECGSMGWHEVTNSSNSFSFDCKKLEVIEEEQNEILENSDIYTYCNECESDNLEEFNLENDKEEIEKIAKMGEDERVKYLKKKEVVENL